ncbi:MAG TPA: Crp/Fnr family transcriptional regulator [Mycobacterium sp.]|nr:Crp/Fnr family transcriptional regulator [Mycobacterium sp.]HTX93843.1 Crp/Fnr family transcriptional regulator [Mycobacterium sp.]
MSLTGEPGRGIRLLVADPDLGSELAPDALERARDQVVFPGIELDPGPLEIDRLRHAAGVRAPLHGYLVIAGSLAINLQMSGRRCTRLIGSRELVLLDGIQGDSIPLNWEWSVLAPARLVLLDARLHAVARHWPPLMSAILERAAQQTRHAFLQQAISQLPRVEERLLALFWSIADRQGVVRSDGVWVELSATHDTLASMVGAQRPTVSLGLTRLAEGGLVRAENGGWLIARDSLDAFAKPSPTAGSEINRGDDVLAAPPGPLPENPAGEKG